MGIENRWLWKRLSDFFYSERLRRRFIPSNNISFILSTFIFKSLSMNEIVLMKVWRKNLIPNKKFRIRLEGPKLISIPFLLEKKLKLTWCGVESTILEDDKKWSGALSAAQFEFSAANWKPPKPENSLAPSALIVETFRRDGSVRYPELTGSLARSLIRIYGVQFRDVIGGQQSRAQPGTGPQSFEVTWHLQSSERRRRLYEISE